MASRARPGPVAVEVERVLVERIGVVEADSRRQLAHAPGEQLGGIAVVEVVGLVVHVGRHHVEGAAAAAGGEQGRDQPAGVGVHLQRGGRELLCEDAVADHVVEWSEALGGEEVAMHGPVTWVAAAALGHHLPDDVDAGVVEIQAAVVDAVGERAVAAAHVEQAAAGRAPLGHRQHEILPQPRGILARPPVHALRRGAVGEERAAVMVMQQLCHAGHGRPPSGVRGRGKRGRCRSRRGRGSSAD